MYFSLINDIKCNSDIYIREPKDLPTELDFMSGEEISIQVDNPMVFTTNAKAGDKLRAFYKSSFTIMSKAFLALMQEAGVDNLQVFPIVIKSTEDGTIWDDYYGVNILGVVKCADLSQSTYDEIMTGHYAFDELAIDVSLINNQLLFRLQEHLPTIIMHRSVGRYIKDRDPEKVLAGWSVKKIIQ